MPGVREVRAVRRAILWIELMGTGRAPIGCRLGCESRSVIPVRPPESLQRRNLIIHPGASSIL